MTRRTKREMELMKDDVTYYLLQTKLKAHQAHELMIEEYLTSGTPIPYYIKGVKDFIKVAQELAIQLNRKELMAKKEQERANQQEIIIDYIMNLTTEEMKVIYSTYKNSVSHSDKLVLNDVYLMIYSNDLDKKYVDQHIINVFSIIYNDMQTKQETASSIEEDISTIDTENKLNSRTGTQVPETSTMESNSNNKIKLHKVSFFTTLYNGERESHSNGYEFTLSSGHKAIVHRSPDNKFWNTTLKEYGVSLTKNSNTRKEAINAANQLINDYGYESIVSKILTLFNERGVSVS